MSSAVPLGCSLTNRRAVLMSFTCPTLNSLLPECSAAPSVSLRLAVGAAEGKEAKDKPSLRINWPSIAC